MVTLRWLSRDKCRGHVVIMNGGLDLGWESEVAPNPFLISVKMPISVVDGRNMADALSGSKPPEAKLHIVAMSSIFLIISDIWVTAF